MNMIRFNYDYTVSLTHYFIKEIYRYGSKDLFNAIERYQEAVKTFNYGELLDTSPKRSELNINNVSHTVSDVTVDNFGIRAKVRIINTRNGGQLFKRSMNESLFNLTPTPRLVTVNGEVELVTVDLIDNTGGSDARFEQRTVERISIPRKETS